MPWSGGNFTRANGNNGWVTDATNGIGIEAGRHDTQDNDFKDGIDQCLNKDGSNAATGNLNFGNFRPTNINAGTAAAPAICAGNDVNTGVFGPAADTWAVATNGVERLRITGGGKILFHCTTSNNAAGEAYFSSVPATEPPFLTFAKTYSGPRNVILNFHNGTYIGGVDMDNVSTSFPTSSDYRLKENVVEIPNSLQRLKTLRPVRFNFISEPSRTIDGFLAHEVKEVVPNAVSGEKDEIHEDGSIKVQALDHSKLVPLLTAALKELNTKVEALEARVAALEEA
jgi:hypothetical protein